jgi:hypothetical protein
MPERREPSKPLIRQGTFHVTGVDMVKMARLLSQWIDDREAELTAEARPQFEAALRKTVELAPHAPPDPGAPAALARGCRCDPKANRDGYGAVVFFGKAWFIIEMDCWLHGPGDWRDA